MLSIALSWKRQSEPVPVPQWTLLPNILFSELQPLQVGFEFHVNVDAHESRGRGRARTASEITAFMRLIRDSGYILQSFNLNPMSVVGAEVLLVHRRYRRGEQARRRNTNGDSLQTARKVKTL